MGGLKRTMAVLVLTAALAALPVRAAEPPAAPVAVREMETLPGCWSPLSGRTEEKAFLLSLTTASLYTVEGETGAIVPLLAQALPQDVTPEYAGSGTYGVPADASRGYAFRISLNPAACWEDGTPVTAGQLVSVLRKMLESGAQALPEFANGREYRRGETRKSGEVVRLGDAGFSSVAEAMEAGITEFYLDTDGFWGLDGGWRLISDRTRLRDYAMPAGMDEQYVSAAYLYRGYLADGARYSHFQRDFVGVPARTEDVLEWEDVGILETGEREVTLILARPTTASALALELEQVYLLRDEREDYGTSAETYRSYGTYRIVSASVEQIVLEPNPNWWGGTEAAYDRVICRRAD